VLVSTPTITGASRIWSAFEEGDQRRRWCPCPDCGAYQVLTWAQVHWQPGRPETAAYTCEECGSLWDDTARNAAVRAGEWRAGAEYTGVASFHIPGLISPFLQLADAVREFLESKGNPERLKTWTNTFLGETWAEQGERIDVHELAERAEHWEHSIPEGVTLLTAGIDVQENRIECEVVGWGDDDVSWSVDYKVIHGDPKASAVWQELTSYLRQSRTHPLFGDIIIRAACLDTGHHTTDCYQYAKATQRVFAIKGIGGEGKPILGKPSTANVLKIPVFPVGTMTAKDTVTGRLKVAAGEAGYCHFPAGRDIEYFKQMTAEEKVKRYHRGFPKIEWVKMRTRNEAFDCRIYATAALELLSADLKALRRAALRDYAARVLPPATDEASKEKNATKRGRVNWATKWKSDA
jgi:phage terminase large subunit GpA-like protein